MLSARSLIGCAGGAIAVLLVAGPAAAETWDSANEYNATSIHAEGDVFFAEQLAEQVGRRDRDRPSLRRRARLQVARPVRRGGGRRDPARRHLCRPARRHRPDVPPAVAAVPRQDRRGGAHALRGRQALLRRDLRREQPEAALLLALAAVGDLGEAAGRQHRRARRGSRSAPTTPTARSRSRPPAPRRSSCPGPTSCRSSRPAASTPC